MGEPSEREQLIAMLDRAGVVWESGTAPDYPHVIHIEAKTGPNNEGYYGFTASFDFNEHGSLLNVGVWE